MPVVTPVNLLAMAPVGRRYVVRGSGVSPYGLGKGGGNGDCWRGLGGFAGLGADRVDEGMWSGLDELSAGLADFYRDLHQHAELSLGEHRTARLLADALRPLGFEVTEHVGGTGVVGVMRNGDSPVVMLRADFDALPVEEQTGLPYACTARAHGQGGEEVPVMHACGHDMHATCLLGAAAMLARTPGTWSGTLLVVFQPAEELARGATDMLNDGLFERFPVPDIVLGQHVGPLPAGVIGYASGPVMAASDSVRVILYGQGGHGSRPEAAIDPVLMAANVVTRLQNIVAREVSPAEAAVVTVGRLQAGTKDNIIPDTAELGVNIRTYSPQTRDLVRAAIERIIVAEASASAAPRPPEITWTNSAPPLVSDPAATQATVAAFSGHFGSERLMPMPLVTASEDVGNFGEAAGVPTVFWFWGGLDAQTVITAMAEGRLDSLPGNHSPYFAPVIEPTLTTGIQALTVAARTWLRTPRPNLGRPGIVPASRQASDPMTTGASRAPAQGSNMEWLRPAHQHALAARAVLFHPLRVRHARAAPETLTP
jgi:amidohydrolase